MIILDTIPGNIHNGTGARHARDCSRAITGLLATASATGLALALGAAPAQAESNLTLSTKAGSGFVFNAGGVFLNATGEIFTLYDQRSDGAGVNVRNDYQKPNSVWDYRADLYHGGSAGTSKSFNMSIVDGSTVWITVCLIDNGDIKESTCSSGVATAYGTGSRAGGSAVGRPAEHRLRRRRGRRHPAATDERAPRCDQRQRQHRRHRLPSSRDLLRVRCGSASVSGDRRA